MTSPTKRGYSTLLVNDGVKARLDTFRGASKAKPKGDFSQSDALDKLLKAAEEESAPSVPVEALEPVSQALHDLDRQVSGDKIQTKEGLLKAIRVIRDQLDELVNR